MTEECAITEEDIAELRKMTTALVRRNYWLCQTQIEMIHEQGCPLRLDKAYDKLDSWQMTYLSELVRRGERV